MRTKEMLKMVGFKQREIEWLQDKGIISKPQKNKYGHFEYTNEDVDQIWIVKFFKEVGYSNNEIKDILSSKEYNEKATLDDLIDKLELKIEKLENLITVAKSIKDNNESIIATKYRFPLMEDLDFNISIFLQGLTMRGLEDFVQNSSESVLTTKKDTKLLIETLTECIFKIIELCNDEESIDSLEVQNNVKKIHSVYSNIFTDSMMLFSNFIIIFAPGSNLFSIINEKYGKEKSKFLYDSLKYYCQNNSTETDKKFREVFMEIINLCTKEYKANSNEVQRQVKIVHDVIYDLGVTTYEGEIELLKLMGKVFGNKEILIGLDDEFEKEIYYYFSTAFEIYVDNLEMKEKSIWVKNEIMQSYHVM